MLHILAIYKSSNGKFCLYEQRPVFVTPFNPVDWQWHEYQDYSLPVRLPRYLPESHVGWGQPFPAEPRNTTSLSITGTPTSD
jgi:hypothetical protein